MKTVIEFFAKWTFRIIASPILLLAWITNAVHEWNLRKVAIGERDRLKAALDHARKNLSYELGAAEFRRFIEVSKRIERGEK